MIQCQICKWWLSSYKGIASHLRTEHNMKNKEYYDQFLKKPNEGICPVCGKPTKYYNITRGYNSHCSVKCSSLDPNVQQKLVNTNQQKYGVNVGFQTKKCVQNSHSKESQLKVYNTKKANGWKRSKIEDQFKKSLVDLNIDYIHEYKSNLYPWKCDFYIPKLNLYVEINNFWTHGNHFFTNSKEDKQLLKKWKQFPRYENATHTWTISDIKKRNTAIQNKLNYVVLWNKSQIDQFLNDLKSKKFKGFTDYNELFNM